MYRLNSVCTSGKATFIQHAGYQCARKPRHRRRAAYRSTDENIPQKQNPETSLLRLPTRKKPSLATRLPGHRFRRHLPRCMLLPPEYRPWSEHNLRPLLADTARPRARCPSIARPELFRRTNTTSCPKHYTDLTPGFLRIFLIRAAVTSRSRTARARLLIPSNRSVQPVIVIEGIAPIQSSSSGRCSPALLSCLAKGTSTHTSSPTSGLFQACPELLERTCSLGNSGSMTVTRRFARVLALLLGSRFAKDQTLRSTQIVQDRTVRSIITCAFLDQVGQRGAHGLQPTDLCVDFL